MPSKRHSVEQIVAKLREAERLQGQGLTIPQLCKRLGISDQTFYRWRLKYGALKEDEAQRLKALEQENARLKKIVADQALDIAMLKDLERGNDEPGRGDAACYLQRRRRVSERRACRLVGLHRSTKRYRPMPPDYELRPLRRMNELAERQPPLPLPPGLGPAPDRGVAINRKRILRLWVHVEGTDAFGAFQFDTVMRARERSI
jgi:transcriptional regulator with XRE-family HTH domain